jgi:hypothetical protein
LSVLETLVRPDLTAHKSLGSMYMSDLNLLLHWCYWVTDKTCLIFGYHDVERLLHSCTNGFVSEIFILLLHVSCTNGHNLEISFLLLHVSCLVILIPLCDLICRYVLTTLLENDLNICYNIKAFHCAILCKIKSFSSSHYVA